MVFKISILQKKKIYERYNNKLYINYKSENNSKMFLHSLFLIKDI